MVGALVGKLGFGGFGVGYDCNGTVYKVFDDVSSLSRAKETWRILVKVIRAWKGQRLSGSKLAFTLEVVLMDNKEFHLKTSERAMHTHASSSSTLQCDGSHKPTGKSHGYHLYGVQIKFIELKLACGILTTLDNQYEELRLSIIELCFVIMDQVWASGFSAAFLNKNRVSTKGRVFFDESGIKVSISSDAAAGPKTAATEAASLLIPKNFFEVILYLPTVNRRLSNFLSMLSTKQPSCLQLYMYSSADMVISVVSVESFVEAQHRAGHDVRACNFVSSPHVDHFRNDPKLYTSQLSKFLEECVQ
ncbi:uncharacterized protein LOC130710747 [Lotus japonicus]|uniref:uncharacterized protein LOC130710747 n=1 Tax=Lotus japonicus TaxID=34305 RepID=UPI0025859BAA|nr:uncharacterized protein LOC130710747 [Lotus japonicus]